MKLKKMASSIFSRLQKQPLFKRIAKDTLNCIKIRTCRNNFYALLSSTMFRYFPVVLLSVMVILSSVLHINSPQNSRFRVNYNPDPCKPKDTTKQRNSLHIS